MITARFANEQGREVFAVPGHPLDPRADGTNQLIKNGATMVTSAADVLEALGPTLQPRYTFRETDPGAWKPPDESATTVSHRAHDNLASTGPMSSAVDSDAARSIVLHALGPAPVNIDELVRVSGLAARVVQATILELALAGRIERHGLNLVSLIPDTNG